MTLTALVSRNPRYFISLAIAAPFLVFLLSHSPSSSTFSSRTYPRPWSQRPPPGYAVQQQLLESESRYNNMLDERKALIAKYGPTVDEVSSFPLHGEHYTLWDFFTPAFPCPHRVQRIGNLGDGGKWVCGIERIEQKKDCVIYSVGINGESSFEAALLERAPGCQIWGYDYSVTSFGPEITSWPSLSARAHFYPYALSGTDAHSAADHPKAYTLPTLMLMNGHSFIDILKIDIEGAEFTALDAFLDAFAPSSAPSSPNRPNSPNSPNTPNPPTNPYSPASAVLPIGQLQLEIHARGDDGYATFPRFLKWWQRLEDAGLRPFWTEPNLVYVNIIRGVRPDLAEYSFMNIRGDHEIIRDAQ